MSAVQKKSTKAEVEQMQRRIWMYRVRGLTLKQIGDAVGKSISTVQYHLKKARKNAATWYEGAGSDEIVGEMILNHRELRQEALRNMARHDPGSRSRLEWAQEARQCLKAESSFLLDAGLIQKAPQRVDVTMKDVRNMTTDEIARDIARLQKELAYTPVRGVTADEQGDDDAPRIIDVESRIKPIAMGQTEDDPIFQEPPQEPPPPDAHDGGDDGDGDYIDIDPFGE